MKTKAVLSLFAFLGLFVTAYADETVLIEMAKGNSNVKACRKTLLNISGLEIIVEIPGSESSGAIFKALVDDDAFDIVKAMAKSGKTCVRAVWPSDDDIVPF